MNIEAALASERHNHAVFRHTGAPTIFQQCQRATAILVRAGTSPVISNRTLTDGGLYFNPAAYVQTAPFGFGNAPRTISDVRNPGTRNIDMLLEKTFATGNHTTFAIRLEAFNVLNYVQLAGPVTSITSASFGAYLFLTGEYAPPSAARRALLVLR